MLFSLVVNLVHKYVLIKVFINNTLFTLS